jgi:hypothetical protein
MRKGFLYYPLGEHLQILQVEEQPDETLKIIKVIFDNKPGNEAFGLRRPGEFIRVPGFFDADRSAARMVKMIFSENFQRFV